MLKKIWSGLGAEEHWERTIVFRIAVACCFIGHGIIALQVAGNYGSEWSYWVRSILPSSIEYKGSELLLRIVGLLDIVDGLMLLLPRIPKQALLWVLGWGFATAASRLYFLGVLVPPFEVNGLHALAEFLKRTPNWVMPLFLVAITSPSVPQSTNVLKHKELIFSLAVASQMLALIANNTFEWLSPLFEFELMKHGLPVWFFWTETLLAIFGLFMIFTQIFIKPWRAIMRIGILAVFVAYCMAEGSYVYSRNLPAGFSYTLIRLVSHFSMYTCLLLWCRSVIGATRLNSN